MNARRRLVVKLDDLLEIVGVGLGAWAVYRLAGLSWCLITVAVALIVAAEFVHTGRAARVPLPHRPHPVARLKTTLSRWRRSP